jgi:eukaryotic translation initiation factor 2C
MNSAEYPNLPLQHADRLPVVNVGNDQRQIWIPAELCEIVSGIPLRGKLTDIQTSTMLQLACNPPASNAQTIMNEGFQKLGFKSEALGEPISNFDITISTTMAVIPARLLPPPGVNYRGNRRSAIRDGSWNIMDVNFQRGGNMENWAVLMVLDQQVRLRFTGPNDPDMWNLIQGFRNKCATAGMNAPNGRPRLEAAGPLAPRSDEDPHRQVALNKVKAAVEKLMNPRPSFILVLLDYRDNYIYPGLKKLCDMELGVATVCMQLNKAMKEQGQDQYFSNVALKVNTKLGGHNHLLDDKDMKWLKQKRTMMVGADVTHPGPTSIDGTPSIAAVVASVDNAFVQYPASLRLQETRKEVRVELGLGGGCADRLVIDDLGDGRDDD